MSAAFPGSDGPAAVSYTHLDVYKRQGLSIAQWIIERHGGYAEVIGREGLGTRFVIHLPAEGEAPKASALPEKKAPAPAADPTAPEK